MKLILVAFFAIVALASAELKWSEDGQYRLVDTEPLEYVTYPQYRLSYPMVYPMEYPMAYRTLKLRDVEPFYYNYQQISKD